MGRGAFVAVWTAAVFSGGMILGARVMVESTEEVLVRCEERVVEKILTREWQFCPAPLPTGGPKP